MQNLQKLQEEYNNKLCDVQNYLLDQPQEQQTKLLKLFADLYRIVVEDQQFSIKLEKFLEQYETNKQLPKAVVNQNITDQVVHQSFQQQPITIKKQSKINQNDSKKQMATKATQTPSPQGTSNQLIQTNYDDFDEKSKNTQYALHEELNQNHSNKKQFEELITNQDQDISINQNICYDLTFQKKQEFFFHPYITNLTIVNQGENTLSYFLTLQTMENKQINFDNQDKHYIDSKLEKDCKIQIDLHYSFVTVKNSKNSFQQEQYYSFQNQNLYQKNQIRIQLKIYILEDYLIKIQMQSDQFFKYKKLEDIILNKFPSLQDNQIQKYYEITRIEQPLRIPIRIDFKTLNLRFQIMFVLTDFRIGVYDLQGQSNEIEYDMRGQQWKNQKNIGNLDFQLSPNSLVEIRQEGIKIIIYFTPINKTKIIKQESKELWTVQSNTLKGIYFLIYNKYDKISIQEY